MRLMITFSPPILRHIFYLVLLLNQFWLYCVGYIMSICLTKMSISLYSRKVLVCVDTMRYILSIYVSELITKPILDQVKCLNHCCKHIIYYGIMLQLITTASIWCFTLFGTNAEVIFTLPREYFSSIADCTLFDLLNALCWFTCCATAYIQLRH